MSVPPPPAQRPPSSTRSSWFRAFLPAPINADWHERLRAVSGSLLGILITALACRSLGGATAGWPWLVAPMGASAVLIFAVPASPLAQPWAVVGGNTLSALVGILCSRWVGDVEFAAALAVGLAIALMFALRCLHPPGGASALLAALSGVHDPLYALHPVLINSVLLVAVGMVYNNATRRVYPHMQLSPVEVGPQQDEADEVDADLDAVLARYNQVLDISRDDLKALLADTQLSAYQRKLAKLRCSDIMSTRLITVGPATPLQQAWGLFRQHHIKAIPVVDLAGSIVGIVTPADFMRAAERDEDSGLADRLLSLQGWADGSASSAQRIVGQVMTRQVRVASMHRHLAELIPLFGSTGHHHIPIIDDAHRLVGIVTQSDVVAALAQSQAAPG